MEIGVKLKEARIRAGMAQERVAEEIQVGSLIFLASFGNHDSVAWASFILLFPKVS